MEEVRDCYTQSVSHPSRVRGLKPESWGYAEYCGLSHPSRVRGLKLKPCPDLMPAITVAPFAGAWIETHFGCSLCSIKNVAPFAGAWIETSKRTRPCLTIRSHPSRVRGLKHKCFCNTAKTHMSHPSRVRGLKPFIFRVTYCPPNVAPFAGAWIETRRDAGMVP